MVTRTGISRALWNSPQDCPTRPGPPASPRPDGLFDSRTEPYKKAEQKKKHLPYKKAGAFGGCGKGFSPDPYGNLPRAKKQSTGLFFAHCGAPPLSRAAAPASGGADFRLPSAAAGPAPAPCIRRRRRSPAQQFLVRKQKTLPQPKLRERFW